jgi:hypothetical protein
MGIKYLALLATTLLAGFAARRLFYEPRAVTAPAHRAAPDQPQALIVKSNFSPTRGPGDLGLLPVTPSDSPVSRLAPEFPSPLQNKRIEGKGDERIRASNSAWAIKRFIETRIADCWGTSPPSESFVEFEATVLISERRIELSDVHFVRVIQGENMEESVPCFNQRIGGKHTVAAPEDPRFRGYLSAFEGAERFMVQKPSNACN